MTLRILYLAMYWDYGDPRRGTSYEQNSFHAYFSAHPGIDVTHFDHFEKFHRLGSEYMNDELVRVGTNGGFDALFCLPFQDEILPASLEAISNAGVTTIGWGADDHWRFDGFSKDYAPAFDYWLTTSRSALSKFRTMGMADRVIKTQWAIEPTVYRPRDLPRDIGVSFIGQPHGTRAQVIEDLRREGVDMETFGFGWDGLNSRITQEEMVNVFSRSKINLNLSNSSVLGEEQIKGRVFEVPGCRGFLLTDAADDLESYYTDGKEIVVYTDRNDLLEKIDYYLGQDDQREAIAQAGYERTLNEHTWQNRFDTIFKQTGLR